MHVLSSFSSVLLAVTALSLAVGCGGSSEASTESPSDSNEDALTTAILPGVAALKVEAADGVFTLGAKAKVAKAMQAFKKNGSAPMCAAMGPATKFTFYDKDGATIATGSEVCFRGSIKLKSGQEVTFVTQPGGLDVVREPMLPADALWGLTKVQVGRPAENESRELADKGAIGKLLDAIDVDQKLDERVGQTRCMPSRMLNFYRGTEKVAYVSYSCDSEGPSTKQKAYMSIANLGPANQDNEHDMGHGGITVDAKAIDEIAFGAAH